MEERGLLSLDPKSILAFAQKNKNTILTWLQTYNNQFKSPWTLFFWRVQSHRNQDKSLK